MTRHNIPAEPLLAAWRDLGNRFSGSHAQFKLVDALTLAAMLIAVAALVGLMLWLQRRQLRRERSNHPAHLFQDLCRAHGLSWRQRRLLQVLAEQLDFTPRAALFVRPDLFAPQELPEALQPYRQAYGDLRERLFADLHEPEVIPPGPMASAISTSGPLPLTITLPTIQVPGGSPVPSA